MLARREQTARKRLAILPWGDLIEDYLDPVGLSLEQMCREMTGGWLFGYVEALQRVGVECVLFVITARVDQAQSLRHEATGMLVRAAVSADLPWPSPLYLKPLWLERYGNVQRI